VFIFPRPPKTAPRPPRRESPPSHALMSPMGRFRLNKAGLGRGQNRSGATPADVSELSQSATWEGGGSEGELLRGRRRSEGRPRSPQDRSSLSLPDLPMAARRPPSLQDIAIAATNLRLCRPFQFSSAKPSASCPVCTAMPLFSFVVVLMNANYTPPRLPLPSAAQNVFGRSPFPCRGIHSRLSSTCPAS